MPGDGGGWLNGEPWPVPDATNNQLPAVLANPSDTSFALQCHRAPTPGVTRVCWLSPLDWRLHTATVVSASHFGGYHNVTIDRPFPGLAAGHLIWPACERAQAYIDALLQAFAMMGPGEMSELSAVLVRSARFPRPSHSWPSELGAPLLRALTDAGREVMAARFAGPALPTPEVPNPADADAAPRVLVPRNVGLYPLI